MHRILVTHRVNDVEHTVEFETDDSATAMTVLEYLVPVKEEKKVIETKNEFKVGDFVRVIGDRYTEMVGRIAYASPKGDGVDIKFDNINFNVGFAINEIEKVK